MPILRCHRRLVHSIAWALGLWLMAPSGWAQITLNLKEADIRTLIDTVSEATGRNFVVDPRVSGKVTVVSAQPMDDQALYQVFLSVLQVHGYSAIDTGTAVKIIPDANAKQDATPLVQGSVPLPGGQLVTRVLKVVNVPVAQLVPILRPLVPQQGQLAAYPPTNVLVMSDRAANVERLAQIVGRIDQPGHTEVEVIALRHAAAGEVVRIIGNVLNDAGKTSPASAIPALAADNRTNSVLLSGDLNARLQARSIIALLDTPTQSADSAQVIYLKYAKAEDLAEVLDAMIQSMLSNRNEQSGQGTQQSVHIAAETQTNALLVSAPPDLMQTVRSLVRQLDIKRAQVLVKAIIAEVSEELTARLGAQLAVNGAESGQGPVGASTFGGTVNNLANIVRNPGAATTIPQGLLLGLGNFANNATQFAVLLEALSGDAASNILSTPSLITLDNHPAQMVVGRNVPFITGSFTNTGSTNPSNPFQTIERRDVGLTLNVTPQINEGNAIKLDIEQEASSLAGSALGATDLITNERLIKTTVLVDDGQLLVLGGLMDESFTDSVQKVPLLGDVPVLGTLFRFTATQKRKRNLLVFIHPTIVRDTRPMDAFSRRKYNYLRALQTQIAPERGSLPGTQPSGFPPLEHVLEQPRSAAAARPDNTAKTHDLDGR